MKIKLLTNDGGLVTEGVIPPFLTPPDCIIWGERIFPLRTGGEDPRKADVIEYREGFTYCLVDNLITLKNWIQKES